MVFNATFSTIFQLYHGGQFYWWRKLEYPKKTTDLLDYVSRGKCCITVKIIFKSEIAVMVVIVW
jgi:hypothetical protein